MINVRVSKETYELVRAQAVLPLKEDKVIKYEDGSCAFPLEEETVARLQGFALKGETLSDTIFRMVTLAVSKAN